MFQTERIHYDRELDIAVSQKIALLITGCYADFYASMKAVQVAGRTDARIHVMQLPENLDDCFNSRKIMQPEELSDLIGLISWLSEVERISVSFHVIGSDSEKEIVEFLRRHDITCLVAGAHDRQCLEQKKKWLQNLQEQLGSDKLWFQRSFQVLVTLPWDDVPFNRALEQLGYKKRQGGRLR